MERKVALSSKFTLDNGFRHYRCVDIGVVPPSIVVPFLNRLWQTEVIVAKSIYVLVLKMRQLYRVFENKCITG